MDALGVETLAAEDGTNNLPRNRLFVADRERHRASHRRLNARSRLTGVWQFALSFAEQLLGTASTLQDFG